MLLRAWISEVTSTRFLLLDNMLLNHKSKQASTHTKLEKKNSSENCSAKGNPEWDSGIRILQTSKGSPASGAQRLQHPFWNYSNSGFSSSFDTFHSKSFVISTLAFSSSFVSTPSHQQSTSLSLPGLQLPVQNPFFTYTLVYSVYYTVILLFSPPMSLY